VTELEQALTALGRELDVPEAPDLAPRVLARLEPRATRRPARPTRRRWLVAIAIAVLAAFSATLAIPEARSALFRILSFGGERIELVDELPDVEIQHDLEFMLGERVTLEEARQRSGFPLRVPDEVPDRVYAGERGTVWFLYGTPASPKLLVAQTPLVSLDETLILKKLAGAGTQIERVAVDGAPGYFISGEAHLLLLLDENGQIVEDSARLARDVLLWERDGIAYRLEGEFDREQALRLAGSLG
jgi:hypothetical protein